MIVEDGFLLPAEVVEDLTDDPLHIWSDGTFAAVILVVTFAREEVDEMVLDGTLQVMGHIVVHPFEADGHADRFVRAILWAVRSLHLRVSEVDIRDNGIVAGHVVFQDVSQTALADRAVLTLAYDVAFRYFTENLFSVWGWSFLHGLFLYGFTLVRLQIYEIFPNKVVSREKFL